jgi:hypothetical protein
MGLPYNHVPPNKTLAAEKGFGPVAGHLGCECYPRADTHYG